MEMEIKRLEVGSFENNCYVIACLETLECVIIDPAADAPKILQETKGKIVRYILITHGHMDHIGSLEEVRKRTEAPVGIHDGDSWALRNKPDFYLQDGQILKFGKIELKVIHTPGHTSGGVCFLVGKTLFSGDTIFPNGPGNTALPGADYQVILESIHAKIFILPDDTIIYPGHGLETTIGREKGTKFYPFPEKMAGGRP
jgi:glyoxylase-like metal-dependent hydrolase (beta-lactamase superfamily II)